MCCLGPSYRLPDLPGNQAASTDPDELIRSPNAPSTVESIVRRQFEAVGGTKVGQKRRYNHGHLRHPCVCDFGNNTGDFRSRAGESNVFPRNLHNFSLLPYVRFPSTFSSAIMIRVGEPEEIAATREPIRVATRFFHCMQMNFDTEAFLDYLNLVSFRSLFPRKLLLLYYSYEEYTFSKSADALLD